MNDTELEARLAKLLEEAGKKHHAAFIKADGVDPEWALWYAGYVQSRFWDAAGRIPTRSELVYLLIGAERAHGASGDDGPWPPFYARYILAEFAV